MNEFLPLKNLGLGKSWPRLARLQDELAGLQEHARQAGTEVELLQNQLAPARERDIDAEAQALRAGKEAPEPTHEPEIQRRLERARRDQAVYARAVEAATSDLGAFRTKHRAALFADVAKARQQIALEVAEAARTALAGFSKHEDLAYLIKDLQPPAGSEEATGPAGSTNVFLGFQTTQQQGPARGHVEQTLAYLVGLASAGEAGGADAA